MKNVRSRRVRLTTLFATLMVALFSLSLPFASPARPATGTNPAPGDLDASFSDDGIVVGGDQVVGLAIQSDGKSVVVGTRRTEESYSDGFQVERYLANGEPDTSFGRVITKDLEEHLGGWGRDPDATERSGEDSGWRRDPGSGGRSVGAGHSLLA